jgi:hypothetical protein
VANVRKFLDLSTAHLTEEQRLFGDRDGDRASWGDAIVDVRDYGFLLWVPDDPMESAAVTEDGIPENLLAVQLYARKHDCDYVLFDADAEVDDDLPVFEERAS